MSGGGRVLEHGGHQEAHECEDKESREEELGCSTNVLEVAAHQDPCLGQEGVGEFWCEVMVGGRVGIMLRGQIVIFIYCVVTAMRCWCAWNDLT